MNNPEATIQQAEENYLIATAHFAPLCLYVVYNP